MTPRTSATVGLSWTAVQLATGRRTNQISPCIGEKVISQARGRTDLTRHRQPPQIDAHKRPRMTTESYLHAELVELEALLQRVEKQQRAA